MIAKFGCDMITIIVCYNIYYSMSNIFINMVRLVGNG